MWVGYRSNSRAGLNPFPYYGVQHLDVMITSKCSTITLLWKLQRFPLLLNKSDKYWVRFSISILPRINYQINIGTLWPFSLETCFHYFQNVWILLNQNVLVPKHERIPNRCLNLLCPFPEVYMNYSVVAEVRTDANDTYRWPLWGQSYLKVLFLGIIKHCIRFCAIIYFENSMTDGGMSLRNISEHEYIETLDSIDLSRRACTIIIQKRSLKSPNVFVSIVSYLDTAWALVAHAENVRGLHCVIILVLPARSSL